MANEAKRTTDGTYATVIASTSTGDGIFNTGTKTDIAAAIGATDEDYAMLDLKIDVTSGSPVADGPIDLFRRAGDGTDQAPVPATDYLYDYIGTVYLDNATDEYFLYGIPNIDGNDEIHAQNNNGVTLTFSVLARGRTYNT